MSKKTDNLTTTAQIRLHPTPEQSRLLMEHCQEYISTANMLVQAQELEILSEDASTKDLKAPLPSVVKNQALRDAQSVYKKSFELGVIPILKKPICQWSNQRWHLTDCTLIIPMWVEGKCQQVFIECSGMVYTGKLGMLRIKKKRGKWIADIVLSHAPPALVESERIMGVDLGIKVPAVSYTPSYGVGMIKVESLAGIREGTTRKSRGASAHKNNRMKNTWSFYQLTQFITYKAERQGISVEQVDPAYTSQECPACGCRNKANDRTYVCRDCGWMGHRDKVGAINISRRTGLSDKRVGAIGA
jgi:IS605 OrfB family transposase